MVARLVGSGHEVVCLLRRGSDTRRIDGLAIERALGDVRDAASVREAIQSCTATIHLAAPGGGGADDAALLHAVIEEGTRNVLDAAAAKRPPHRVVVVSSTAAVNASDRPRVFDERSAFTIHDRRLHYAHAKHRAELIASDMHARGVPVVVVNPAEVYGPGDTALGTARNLIDFLGSNPVLVCSGGTSIVHVDDVASGIVAALDRGRAGERYILGGENLTIRQLAQLVLRLAGRRARVLSIPNSLARAGTRIAVRAGIPLPYEPSVVPYATRYWFMDSSKARRELGVTFRGAVDTLRSTLDWLASAIPSHIGA